MDPKIKTGIIWGSAIIVGLLFAFMVNPIESNSFAENLAGHGIGFLIGFLPVGIGLTWLLKKLNL